MLQRITLRPKHYRAIGMLLVAGQVAVIVLALLSLIIPLN